MDFYGSFSNKINSYNVVCAITMSAITYTTPKKDSIVIDPRTGKQVEEVTGILSRNDFISLKRVFDRQTFYDSLQITLFGIIDETEDYAERNVFYSPFLNTAASAYVSAGCIIFNSGIVSLKNWAYTKQFLKNNPKDALEILLTDAGAFKENRVKGYMESVSKAFTKLANSQNQILLDESNKQKPENFSQIMKYTICHLTQIPVIVALVYCSCFPYGDSKCTTIFKDLIKHFPKEVSIFSQAIEAHLLNISMFNPQGILEQYGGKVSFDYVRMVALIMIGPYVYLNLRVLLLEGENYCGGKQSLEEFQNKTACLYADSGLINRRLKGKFNEILYLTTKDKYCYNCGRWFAYTLWAGYVSMRFGYDILGSILGVPVAESAILDLNDNMNIKRQEFLAKYEATFMEYDETGKLIKSSEIFFGKLLPVIGVLKNVAGYCSFGEPYFRREKDFIKRSIPQISKLLD